MSVIAASAVPRHRPRRALAGVFVAMLLAMSCSGFLALGTWQIQRLHWKHDLIARVDARLHAEPVAAPDRAQWPGVTRERHEYRRVVVEGRFLDGPAIAAQAVTEAGAGRWHLNPLRTDAGHIVLINRGFVPAGLAHDGAPPAGHQRIVGLLRISEPGGGFLRRNDPARERWFSRDVTAMAQARGLNDVAPYFIDAQRDADAAAEHWPRAGMTVVRFRDTHLAYALTWFALAAMAAFALWKLLRMERDMRQHGRFRPGPIPTHATTHRPPEER